MLDHPDVVRPHVVRTAPSASPAPRTPRRLTTVIGCAWPLMAVGVREAAERGGIHSCAVAQQPDDLIGAVGRQHPDLCLVIDPFPAHLPEVIARLSQVSRSTRTVVLAADLSPAGHVLAALRAGAAGWLPMDTDSSRLVDALRAVADGEAAVPRSLMSEVLAELRGAVTRDVVRADGPVCQLPPREHDVLLGLAEGLTAGQVAERLGIGVATARGYVATAVRRLAVADRATAVALVAPAHPALRDRSA